MYTYCVKKCPRGAGYEVAQADKAPTETPWTIRGKAKLGWSADKKSNPRSVFLNVSKWSS